MATEAAQQQLDRLRIDEGLVSQLSDAKRRCAEVVASLAKMEGLSPKEIASLQKELHRLEPLCAAFTAFRKLQVEETNLHSLTSDPDPEVREIANSELAAVSSEKQQLERQLVLDLLPEDEHDSRDVILEVRAGAGGSEASLFAEELFEMYRGFASSQGWRFESLESAAATLTATVSGESVYATLKYENGVHRIQRVPTTETKGRTHTSTASVLVMPEAQEVDVAISPADLKVETMRASGAGGQHVNTTDSAVRVTHLPTGISAHVAEERSQHKNRERALKLIATRVADHERQKAMQQQAVQRRSLVGSGDRSERIRTYNFSENRITDHRIGLSMFGMDDMLAGLKLRELVSALELEDKLSRIDAMSKGD